MFIDMLDKIVSNCNIINLQSQFIDGHQHLQEMLKETLQLKSN